MSNAKPFAAFVLANFSSVAFAAGFSTKNIDVEQLCLPSNPECKIVVKASLVFDTAHPSVPPRCRVDINSGNIMNPARAKGVDKPVKLVWEIVKDSADSTTYEFTEKGIEFLNNKNDEDYDLDNGGWPKSAGSPVKQKYKWRNLNGRFIRLAYNVNVQFKTTAMTTFSACDEVDPVIINKGD